MMDTSMQLGENKERIQLKPINTQIKMKKKSTIC